MRYGGRRRALSGPSFSVSPLSISVGLPPLRRCPVAASSGAYARLPRLLGAAVLAVDLTVVALATDGDLAAASSAQEEARDVGGGF